MTSSSSTTLLDQELIYHIGANSQPISFEWTRHTGTGESQTTTTSTYYYHYDVHGNTLKVTDTNQDTKITYTYDTLGNITSQTNPDSIPNPFTFMGASQTILDTETNLYFSSGYYNPQTGTLLQGTGSPAMPNPTSISTINSMSTSSLPEAQLLSHSITSATTAGSSSGGEPGSFSPPPGPEDGIANAGEQQMPDSSPSSSMVGSSDISISVINNNWETDPNTGMLREKRRTNFEKEFTEEEKKEAALRYLDWAMKSTEFKEHTPFAFWGALHGEGLSKLKFKDIPPPLQQAFVEKMIEAGGAKTEEEARDKLARSDWLAWHIDKDGKILVVGYQIHDEKPVFFWGPYGPNQDFSDPVKNALGVVPGKKVDRGFADWFCNSWIEHGIPIEICTLNFSGNNIRIRQYMDSIEKTNTQTYFEFAVSSDFFGCQKIGKAGFIDRYKGSSYEQEDLALSIGPGSCVVILGNENDGFLHGAFYVYGRNGERTMFKRFRWSMSDDEFKAIFGETWAKIIKPSIGTRKKPW